MVMVLRSIRLRSGVEETAQVIRAAVSAHLDDKMDQ